MADIELATNITDNAETTKVFMTYLLQDAVTPACRSHPSHQQAPQWRHPDCRKQSIPDRLPAWCLVDGCVIDCLWVDQFSNLEGTCFRIVTTATFFIEQHEHRDGSSAPQNVTYFSNCPSLAKFIRRLNEAIRYKPNMARSDCNKLGGSK